MSGEDNSNEDDSQERTEDPTPKRQQDAKEKGQIARSKDLTTSIVMLLGSSTMLWMSEHFSTHTYRLLQAGFSVERSAIFDEKYIVIHLVSMVIEGFSLVMPLLILLFFSVLGAAMVLGGITFNLSSLGFQFNRMDPIKGLKRIFSLHALLELVKALAKFLLIGTCFCVLLWKKYDVLLSLGRESVMQAIMHSFSLLAWSFLLISSSLILIAILDVPFQLWNNAKQLKMTKQELRDEAKDTEGKPEVKSKIRQLQNQMARSRMMSAVPKADVVITNPTHFAVALVYNSAAKGAPTVVAKGLDLIALQIQQVAKANKVIVLELPPLARSIYYSTELEHEIPAALYIAVAQVLAYVYQLRQHRKGYAERPQPLRHVAIPDEYKKYQ